MGCVTVRPEGKWSGEQLVGEAEAAAVSACLCLGRNNAGISHRIQVECVWLRLFLIQGHCVLVSINSEINTALQSAPFINGVTHLMRALLTHINLSSQRGPSRNLRQLPAWIYSALACGKPSHSASTFALQGWGSTKPPDSTRAHDAHKL